MNTYKRISIIVLLCLWVLLPGCFPKKVVWSPDGETAAVWNSEGLYFCDADGNLSEKVYGQIYCVGWLSDNRRLVVQTIHEVKSWPEVEKLADKRLVDEIKALAKLAKEGDDLEKEMLQEQIGKNMARAVEMCMDPNLKLGESFALYTIELCSWQDGTFKVEKKLGNFGCVSFDISVSPLDKIVMLAQCEIDNNRSDDDTISSSQLWLVEIASGKTILLAKGVSLHPAWSNDGSNVIYASKETVSDGDGIFLGQIVSAKVADDSGLLVEKVDSTRTLAGAVMSLWTRIRVLPDGKIIFPSMSVSLPTVPDELPEQMDLFVLDPKLNTGVSRIGIKDKQEKLSGFDFNFYDVSSNGRYVSLVDEDSRVAVLDLTNGQVKIVQSEDIGDLKAIPDWRNDNEVTYLSEVTEDGESRNVVMCWDMSENDQGGRELSKSWPQEVVDNLRD